MQTKVEYVIINIINVITDTISDSKKVQVKLFLSTQRRNREEVEL